MSARLEMFAYQETEVDIGAKEWAEDDWDHDVRPVAGDIVYHEERKRCHGRQQELEEEGNTFFTIKPQ